MKKNQMSPTSRITGRLKQEPNYQNIPIRTEQGNQIKAMVVKHMNKTK